KRSRPLTVIISTAGAGQGGLAWDWWDYSHKVASGEIEDPSFAPIIFAADPEADWQDEDAWRQANPAIDAGFCSIEELRIKARRIQHFPAEIADFRRFHLNQWQEGAAEPWIALDLYDAAEEPMPESELLGRPCYVGVDLSSVEDLSAIVAVFPDGPRYDVKAHFFLPEEGLQRKVEEDRADYLRWAKEGYITLTPGNVIDHYANVEQLNAWATDYSNLEVESDHCKYIADIMRLPHEGY